MSNPHHGAAMTFEEIAAEMGISPQRALQIFKRGMAKLRRRRNTPALVPLKQLAEELQQQRERAMRVEG